MIHIDTLTMCKELECCEGLMPHTHEKDLMPWKSEVVKIGNLLYGEIYIYTT